jgi:hypothetical protein
MEPGIGRLALLLLLAAGAAGASTLTIGAEEVSSGEPLCVS